MKKISIIIVALMGLYLMGNNTEIFVKNGESIAFVGDSITQFGNRPDGFIRLVMNGLKKGGISAKEIPAGVSGNKSNDILERLPEILEKKPNWIVLQCGTNDVGHGINGVKLEDYKKNIIAILNAAKTAKIKVMLVTPSMHSEDFNSANNKKLKDYCEFIRSQAKINGLLLADWNNAEHNAIKERSHIKGLKVTIDNLHLDGYGNRFLAETILATFKVPEKVIKSMHSQWNEIPSMPPILNAWYDPQYKISIKDYEILYRIAEKQNKSVSELIQDITSTFIKEKKKELK